MINYDNPYHIACEYMAKTELYDRTLTHKRSPYDHTEAYILTPWQRRFSTDYSRGLITYYKSMGIDWGVIHKEILKHRGYTAQYWIDEYNMLLQGGI